MKQNLFLATKTTTTTMQFIHRLDGESGDSFVLSVLVHVFGAVD